MRGADDQAGGIDAKMQHQYFSFRKGVNKNPKGLPFSDIRDLTGRILSRLKRDGYFDEAFGFICVDEGPVPGKIKDPELEILLEIRKKNLWPVESCIDGYSEDDLFDILEFLYLHVSKPVEGRRHDYENCGMHWETFSKAEGQKRLASDVNRILEQYEKRFELAENGWVLERSDEGFEQIFKADIPTTDHNVRDRITSANLLFRRHGSTIDDRRHAVHDLADVFEYLRSRVKGLLSKQDENDLFNIANNFDIRHHNEQQKSDYDGNLWLSWMFYFYLATVHVLLRKIDKDTGKS